MTCQLEKMAFARVWPRSCSACGLFGTCQYGYKQVKQEGGFYITQYGKRVGREHVRPERRS